ncbi:MAG: hypothetical protein GY842_01380, partial [bacterium]|nr:hypothetical protein [bacterium]
MDEVSGPNRVVITSSSVDEISYRGVENPDTGVRDGEFFLMEFFRNAGAGRNLKESFELASAKTAEYTNSRSNGAAGEVPQHPRLDDNEDGIGTTGQLSTVSGEDGARVSGMELGLGSNAGNGVTWFRVSAPKFIEPGASVGEVVGETAGRAPAPEDEAWLEIKAPLYDNGELPPGGRADLQRVAEMIGPIYASGMQDLGGGEWGYRWAQADLEAHPDFTSFNTPGTYKVYYFLRDHVTGQVGAYLVTNVYVSQADNKPPNPVSLLYP